MSEKKGFFDSDKRIPDYGVINRMADMVINNNDLQGRLNISSNELDYFRASFTVGMAKKEFVGDIDGSIYDGFDDLKEGIMIKSQLTPSVVCSIDRASNMLTSLLSKKKREDDGVNFWSQKLFESEESTYIISSFKKELAEARKKIEKPQKSRSQIELDQQMSKLRAAWEKSQKETKL